MLSQGGGERETESTAERRLGIATWMTVDLESKQAERERGRLFAAKEGGDT